MENFRKILGAFASDMQKYSSDDTITRFVYQNKTHFLISALVGSKSEGMSFEQLCNTINTNICSRSTIQKVLEIGVKCEAFTKKTSENDKRVRHYQLTGATKNFFNEWVKRQKTIFKKL